MDKKIIIINGSGGAGKDTFVEYCSEFRKVLNVSAVDKVKEAAKVLVGWDGTKDDKSRKLLVDLKQLSIEYNDAPTKYIVAKAEEFKESDDELMFVHIREAEEIDKAKGLLGASTLLVTNPNVPIITTNSSDAKVNEYNYDYTILNDGTLDELKDKAKQFVDSIVPENKGTGSKVYKNTNNC
jgi:hypothetical protein